MNYLLEMLLFLASVKNVTMSSEPQEVIFRVCSLDLIIHCQDIHSLDISLL